MSLTLPPSQLVQRLAGQKVVRVASYNEHTAALVEPTTLSDGGSRNYAPGIMVSVNAGFIHDLKEMVNDDEYSDVTFIVEGQPVYALRGVLAKRCEHFAAMFRSGMRESEEGVEIPIPNISRAVFLLILEYLYTDSVKVELEHAVELYIAADLYQIASLRDMSSSKSPLLSKICWATCLSTECTCIHLPIIRKHPRPLSTRLSACWNPVSFSMRKPLIS